MYNSPNSSARGNIGLLGLLTITFIVLKLCHVIDWSWWWVLTPFWGPFVIVLLIIFFYKLAMFAKRTE